MMLDVLWKKHTSINTGRFLPYLFLSVVSSCKYWSRYLNGSLLAPQSFLTLSWICWWLRWPDTPAQGSYRLRGRQSGFFSSQNMTPWVLTIAKWFVYSLMHFKMFYYIKKGKKPHFPGWKGEDALDHISSIPKWSKQFLAVKHYQKVTAFSPEYSCPSCFTGCVSGWHPDLWPCPSSCCLRYLCIL